MIAHNKKDKEVEDWMSRQMIIMEKGEKGIVGRASGLAYDSRVYEEVLSVSASTGSGLQYLNDDPDWTPAPRPSLREEKPNFHSSGIPTAYWRNILLLYFFVRVRFRRTHEGLVIDRKHVNRRFLTSSSRTQSWKFIHVENKCLVYTLSTFSFHANPWSTAPCYTAIVMRWASMPLWSVPFSRCNGLLNTRIREWNLYGYLPRTPLQKTNADPQLLIRI